MRYEKQLLAWEVPECPALEQRPPNKVDRYKTEHYYRFAAQLVELGGEIFLGITVFNMGGGAKFRLWQNRDQQGLQVFEVQAYDYSHKREPGKMYGGSIDSCMQTGRYWTSNPEILYGTEEDEKTAYAFLGIEGTDVAAALSKYQGRVRKEKNERRDEKERARIREMFTGIEEPDESFKEWCIDELLKDARFFFYDYTGKKKQSGVCSHCGTRSELEGIREFKRGGCPACGSSVEFRSFRKLEKSRFTRSDRTMLAQRLPDSIVLRSFYVWLEFRAEMGRPVRKLHITEKCRHFVCPGSLERTAAYSRESGTYAVTVDGFHADGVCCGLANPRVCPLGLKEIREELGIRAPVEKLAEHGLRGDIDAILRESRLRPELEFLIKGRFYRLAASEMEQGWSERRCLKKGSTAAEVLGVSAREVDKIREANPSGRCFELIRLLLNDGRAMKAEDMADMQALNLKNSDYDKLRMMLNETTLRKALNWLKKQCALRGSKSGSDTLHTWCEYMSLASQIGFDLGDSQMSFPKDIQKAHAEAVKVLNAKKDAALNAAVAKRAAALERYCWTYNGLSIRPCRSQTEMINEGETLHHCVGKNGYAEKMAKGKTAIFLIRKEKEPELPYVTLELNLNNGRVIQCYADRDKYPGDKVKAFYRKWEKEIVSAGYRAAETA